MSNILEIIWKLIQLEIEIKFITVLNSTNKFRYYKFVLILIGKYYMYYESSLHVYASACIHVLKKGIW